MKIEILSQKKIEHRSWYLAKGNLWEYIDSLKPDFYEFAIQRKIVKNIYLDGILETIKSGDPMPMITLTHDSPLTPRNGNEGTELNLQNVEILDGLQRTFRLWAYKIIAESKNNHFDPAEYSRHLKSRHPMFFESGVISTSKIRKLFANNDIGHIIEKYKKYDVYFIIWAGLSSDEIVNKMLFLNAGQKSVTKTHQYELLFLHYFNLLAKKGTKITLKREKDSDANKIKKGEREYGEFMFSSIIVALQSFLEKKPLRVETEDLISQYFDESESDSLVKLVFGEEFLLKYLDWIFIFDQTIGSAEISYGKAWFVKDTTLSGFFAAIGKHVNISKNDDNSSLTNRFEDVCTKLKNTIQLNGLGLKDFDREYDKVSSRSVNIGNYIRKVIAIQIGAILEQKDAYWGQSFQAALNLGLYE